MATKISAMTPATALTGAELIPIVQAGVNKTATPALLGWYSVYTALLTQAATSAPVATILANTIGTITWTYSDVGSYIATSAGAFTDDKTIVFANFFGTNGEAPRFIEWRRINANSIEIISLSQAGLYVDVLGGTGFKCSIEIRVYT